MKTGIKPAFEVTDEAVENMGCIFAYELREQGIEALYTQKQMIKFANEKCSELMDWYIESTEYFGHAAETKIWFDNEFGDIEDDCSGFGTE